MQFGDHDTIQSKAKRAYFRADDCRPSDSNVSSGGPDMLYSLGVENTVTVTVTFQKALWDH